MLAILFQSWAAAGEAGPAPARNDFESFRIISQRNIFNPNRSSRPARNETSDTPRAARTESFTLVGTMLYDDVQMAFFDSSSAAYKKAVKPSDEIGGCKITEVSAAGVKLETGGKTLEVAVGQQVRRQDEGEWKVTGKPADTASASSAPSPDGSSAASAGAGDDDEVLKRLLKKREEENK